MTIAFFLSENISVVIAFITQKTYCAVNNITKQISMCGLKRIATAKLILTVNLMNSVLCEFLRKSTNAAEHNSIIAEKIISNTNILYSPFYQ